MNDVVMSRAPLADTELPAYQGIQLDQVTLVVSAALAASALTALMAGCGSFQLASRIDAPKEPQR